jgi:hypothetical protein
MKNKIILILLFFGAVVFVGCPDSVVVDPCAGAEPVTARFSTYEVVYGTGDGTSDKKAHLAKTDTFIYLTPARFAADERYDSYEWHIGYDSRVRTDSAFTLSFSSTQLPADEPLSIMFIGRRKPRTDCFPNDDGIDTATRFIVYRNAADAKILGSYLGHHADENPLDTFTVDIFWKSDIFLAVRNINRGFMDDCTKLTSRVSRDIGNVSMGFSIYATVPTCGLLSLDGYMRLLPGNRDSIIIDYIQTDRAGDGISHHKVFTGRRIR